MQKFITVDRGRFFHCIPSALELSQQEERDLGFYFFISLMMLFNKLEII